MAERAASNPIDPEPCEPQCQVFLDRAALRRQHHQMGLSQFLSAFAPTIRSLGLVHCAPLVHGVKMLAECEIQTHPCAEYADQPLIYLFYGRPAYKPLPLMAPSGIAEHLPMCFVLDPKLLGKAVRVLPFDSGGFARYARLVDPLTRSAFEVSSRDSSCRRIVSAFYETNLAYFQQLPTRHEDDISLLHPEARAIARLAHDRTIIDDDDRCTTIEVQLGENIALTDALKAIVGPPIIMDEPSVLDAIRASDAIPITYQTFGRQTPGFYSGQVYERVLRFFKRQRMFQ